MSIEDCARVAAAWWPDRNTAITMTAIAGAESGYNPRAQGDYLELFNPLDQARYAPFACNGYLSHGYWQVFLGVHSAMISRMSKFDSPCQQANWLYVPDNNARAAAAILANAKGFTPWSVFNAGTYQAHLTAARDAVDAARSTPTPPPPPQLIPTAAELRLLAAIRELNGERP